MTASERHDHPKGRKIPKRAIKFLEEERNTFIECMGRPPTESDRAFYSSYCFSSKELKNETIKSMLIADAPQLLVHIFETTGFVVDKKTYKKFSKAEKEEIENSILDYEALEAENNQPIYRLENYDDLGDVVSNPLIQVLYVIGNFIEVNINSGKYVVDSQRFICAYLTVRSFRLIRAILRSQQYTTSEESLLLIRSLYECYCKITYATQSKRNAKYLIDSDLGLVSGEYEVFRKDGKARRNTLIHKKSKKLIPRHRSFYEYISSSPLAEDIELFTELYEYLSSFVHTGSRHVLRTWVDQNSGFSLIDDHDEQSTMLVLILATSISAMLMQSILRLKNISHTSRFDMRRFCYATKNVLADIEVNNDADVSELIQKLKARTAVLPKNRIYKKAN